MTKHNPASITVQIEPRVDPVPPESGGQRYDYFLLEPLHSPPIIPPNSTNWLAYPEPRSYFQEDNPDDRRRAYGAAVYPRPLTWKELENYNMLPMDYNEALLYDLFMSFSKDIDKMTTFLGHFFNVTKGDPGLRRLSLATKLFSRGATFKSLKQQMREVVLESSS